jgi:SAM-dependent methyltransferase
LANLRSERVPIVRRRSLAGLLLAGVCAAAAAQDLPKNDAVFLPFDDARTVLEFLAPVLPSELKSPPVDSQAALWPAWVRQGDAATRARLARGDEDSLVNLLMFGTSFTKQPRITAQQIELIITTAADPAAAGSQLDAVTRARLDDLVAGAAHPGGSERLAYARQVLTADGFNPDTPGGQSLAKAHLLAELGRVLKEIDTNARAIERARRAPIPGAEFAERSRLYRSRGLSSDTSLVPNFAVEESLKAMIAQKKVNGAINRVAVIGPGLDFADKQEGYDFYPVQTLQPFAIVDSLLRLGLADAAAVRVTTLDLSPRVNAHVAHLRGRALRGEPYIVQLPLDAGERWSADVVRYWGAFGDRIGSPAAPAFFPANTGGLKLRAVSVRPAVGLKVIPSDVNIVFQRLELPAEEKFDLIVATNVFVYYDDFQKALAMVNIEKMLKPGGILLSNNLLVQLPSSRLRWVGDTTVAYSERKDNGDTVVWYQASKN